MIRLCTSLACVVLVLFADAAHAEGESISLAKGEVIGGKPPVEAQLVIRVPRTTSTSYRISLTGPVSQRALELTLPAGATSAGFSIAALPVLQNSKIDICASSHPPVCDATAKLIVLAPRLQTLRFDATTVTNGTAFQGEVLLDGPAPAGGFEVDLVQSPGTSGSPTTGPCSELPGGALAPDSVLIPAGLGNKKFTVPTYFFPHSVQVNQLNVVVAARAAGIEKLQTLTVQKLRFTSFTIQPAAGARPLNVTVSFSLNGPSPESQTVRADSSGRNPPDVAQTTLAAGQQSGSFPMALTNGKSPVVVTLFATCVSSSNTRTVDLLPAL